MSKIILTLLLFKSAFATSGPIISVRFDPGYLYSTEYAQYGNSWNEKDRASLQDALIAHWQRMSVNRVYILIYNPVFGWNYPINHPHTETEAGLGKTPFLKELIYKMQKAEIEPWAWVYYLQGKQAWQNEPSWREVFLPSDAKELFLLKPHLSANWMNSLITKMKVELPHIQGIDFAEPQAIVEKSQKSLTHAIISSISHAKSIGLAVAVTPLIQADKNGVLLSEKKLKKLIGLDWRQVLRQHPDILLSPQLQFQEWRQGPAWSRKAYLELRRRYGEAARIGVHLEFSSFATDLPHVSPAKLASAIFDLSREKNLACIDLYDSHLAWQIFGPPSFPNKNQKEAPTTSSVRNSP